MECLRSLSFTTVISIWAEHRISGGYAAPIQVTEVVLPESLIRGAASGMRGFPPGCPTGLGLEVLLYYEASQVAHSVEMRSLIVKASQVAKY